MIFENNIYEDTLLRGYAILILIHCGRITSHSDMENLVHNFIYLKFQHYSRQPI